MFYGLYLSHMSRFYGNWLRVGGEISFSNFRIPIYGNTADRVGKLCFYQPINATSACVLRVLAVVYEDLKRLNNILR